MSINTAVDPALKAGALDGSLFVWQCEACGQRNLARYETLYHDPEKKLMIWLLPEGALDESRMEAISQQVSALEGYTLRRVSDTGSLVEKTNIFEAGLDDVVVEMCKWVTRMEMVTETQKSDQDKARELMETPFKFYRMDGADNEISLSFPLSGQMMGIKIGFNVYEDCLGIVSRNPSLRPEEGFACVDAAWIASKLKS